MIVVSPPTTFAGWETTPDPHLAGPPGVEEARPQGERERGCRTDRGPEIAWFEPNRSQDDRDRGVSA